jgi:hypothetical protein
MIAEEEIRVLKKDIEHNKRILTEAEDKGDREMILACTNRDTKLREQLLALTTPHQGNDIYTCHYYLAIYISQISPYQFDFPAAEDVYIMFKYKLYVT